MRNLIIFIEIIALSMNFSEMNAQNHENQNQRIGFAGAIFTSTPSKEYGVGIEVATVKNNVGFGVQVEYIPETNPNFESSTFIRGFLLFKITNNFFIKTAAGIKSQGTKMTGFHQDNYLDAGIGPIFLVKKVYFGIQPNISFSSNESLELSTISGVFGLKFQ